MSHPPAILRRAARLATAAALALPLVACGDAPADPPRDARAPRTVLLVSLDTLRPGRLGVYGGQPGVSPNLDAFAARAVVFDDALAPAPWTLPSHMTMLSGLDPVAHDVRVEKDALSPDVTTLAEALRAAGFATAAFTDGGYVSAKYGFDQGFDVFDDDRASRPVHGMEHLAPSAADWLAAQDGDAFLFVHTFDAHSPYDSPPADDLQRFRARPSPDGPDDWGLHFLSHFAQQREHVGLERYRRMSELLDDYDAGVHVADRGVGRLLDALERTGRIDDALVIVTSDHGESFFDCGLHVGHGLLPSQAELHVPLLVRFPDGGGAGTRRPELVSLVDLAPTVLDALGLEPPSEWQGESLRGLADGRARRTGFVLGASRNLHCWYLAKGDWMFVSPMGVDPIMVARAHLGPDSGDGTEYAFGAADEDGERLTLHYDTVGDPFGLREIIPADARLFDRRDGDCSRVDMWEREPVVLQHMLALFHERMAESTALSKRLRKGEQEERSDGEARAQQRALAGLGYLADVGDDAGALPEGVPDVAALRGPPKAVRSVDGELLVASDRLVHRVRVLLAEGGAAGEAERADLQEAGALCMRWLAKNPTLSPRVGFRLLECERLASEAGVDLDLLAWQRELGSHR